MEQYEIQRKSEKRNSSSSALRETYDLNRSNLRAEFFIIVHFQVAIWHDELNIQRGIMRISIAYIISTHETLIKCSNKIFREERSHER